MSLPQSPFPSLALGNANLFSFYKILSCEIMSFYKHIITHTHTHTHTSLSHILFQGALTTLRQFCRIAREGFPISGQKADSEMLNDLRSTCISVHSELGLKDDIQSWTFATCPDCLFIWEELVVRIQRP